jgi:hypothetical protein
VAEEKKIIVDEDWKEEAQREKERLAAELEQTHQATAVPQPANFSLLVSLLAEPALVFLGMIANPLTGKPSVDLAQARAHIDLLEVLEAKTKGNLEPEEAKLLDEVLYTLRMQYVAQTRQ